MNIDTKPILELPRVQQIISKINATCKDIASHEDNYDFLNPLCEICYEGETKTVLLHKDWDFVIKIPNYYEYPKHNYCQLEVEKYASAKTYRVEKVLLETAFLIELENGISLYVQPKYSGSTVDLNCNSTKLKALRKKLNNLYSENTKKAIHEMYDYNRISKVWFSRVIQLYGKRFARSLEKWTKDNCIGDLHDNNTGWYNKQPIILDYSGYYGR